MNVEATEMEHFPHIDTNGMTIVNKEGLMELENRIEDLWEFSKKTKKILHDLDTRERSITPL